VRLPLRLVALAAIKGFVMDLHTESVIQNPVIRGNAVYSRTSEEISRHAAEGN
jgi:hypothetical protein